MKCGFCKQNKQPTDFWDRYDRNGKYAFCIDCCKKQGRTKEYPVMKKRGGSQFRPRLTQD